MRPSADLHGLLVVDKPAGFTSHDVVGRLRRLTGERRIGHAGTLDPAATGVLPLGLGQGTRLLEYLGDADKRYRATIRLGAATDTDDAEGAVIAEGDWRSVTEAQARAALAAFVGPLEQVPPAYSAIKRDGVALHRLARAGRPVAVAPRPVRIDAITVLAVTLPELTVVVACSKGTYIRSLARDLGETLGCFAHLAALRRLRHGPFDLSAAHSLDALAAAAEGGTLPALLLPPDLALRDRPAAVLDARSEWLLLTGRTVKLPAGEQPAGPLRVYGGDGAFLAVARGEAGGWLRPDKVFALPQAGGADTQSE